MLGNVFPQKKQNSGETGSERSLTLENSLELEVQEINPTGTDLATEEQLDQSQIGMEIGGLARPKQGSKIWRDVRKWENLVEVMPFWKIPVFPINITVIVATLISLYSLIIYNFTRLPDSVPLFYSAASSSRILVDKTIFLIFPVIITVLEVFMIRLNRVIFGFDRRLSMVISYAMIIFNLLLIVAVLQLNSLLLI